MSSLLLKIDFKDKKVLSPKIFMEIYRDMISLVRATDYFDEKEKVFMNYKIKPNKKTRPTIKKRLKKK